jgi:heme-degrading monooxygenase HmoA
MAAMYLRVWEYEVAVDHVDGFVAAYGPEGEWVRLFRGAQGYVGTGLFRSTDEDGRFITVDRWMDRATWLGFLQTSRQAYEALDQRLEGLATTERPLLEGIG